MKIKDGEFVMPGDELAFVEELIPESGAYDEDGTIKSAVMGNVAINPKDKTLSVKAKNGEPVMLKAGDYVYGQITEIRSQRATVDIEGKVDCQRALALPYTGSIHISKVNNEYLDYLNEAFRIGDIVKVKVDKVTGKNVDFNTTSPECGVLKAMCTRCRGYMHTTENKNELECNVCNKKEKRKVSTEYVNK